MLRKALKISRPLALVSWEVPRFHDGSLWHSTAGEFVGIGRGRVGDKRAGCGDRVDLLPACPVEGYPPKSSTHESRNIHTSENTTGNKKIFMSQPLALKCDFIFEIYLETNSVQVTLFSEDIKTLKLLYC